MMAALGKVVAKRLQTMSGTSGHPGVPFFVIAQQAERWKPLSNNY
jgi:hypothetical protein